MTLDPRGPRFAAVVTSVVLIAVPIILATAAPSRASRRESSPTR